MTCYSITQARDGRLVVDRDRQVSSDHYFVLASSGELRPASSPDSVERAYDSMKDLPFVVSAGELARPDEHEPIVEESDRPPVNKSYGLMVAFLCAMPFIDRGAAGKGVWFASSWPSRAASQEAEPVENDH